MRATVTSSPGATLMKNSHRQPSASVIQPPMVGPSVGANVETTPSTAIAIARLEPSKNENTVANTTGIIAPPTNPCTARNRIIEGRSQARPQSRLESVNRPAEIANSQRVDSACARNADSGIMTISAIR